MKPQRHLNHELIGCKVEYQGSKYRVTGARRMARGIKFRLLDYFRQKEFWTRTTPQFGTIEPPIYKGSITVLPPKPGTVVGWAGGGGEESSDPEPRHSPSSVINEPGSYNTAQPLDVPGQQEAVH